MIPAKATTSGGTFSPGTRPFRRSSPAARPTTVAAAALAATVVGQAAGLLRRKGRVPWGKVPPRVVAFAGIIPLLPGRTAYRGFYQLSVEGVADGLVTVTLALAIGLALAAGVTLGQFLTRPQATPLAPSDPARQGKRNQ